MMQLGQTSITSNNGWSGMLTQNLQPAPGSNPFFNLTAQQQQTAAFTAQVCKFQQMYFEIFFVMYVYTQYKYINRGYEFLSMFIML